jgi:choline monooxygenase
MLRNGVKLLAAFIFKNAWIRKEFMKTPAISTYFDPKYFALEQEIIFANSAQYRGHQLQTPYPYDYLSLEWLNHSKLLYNNNNTHVLIDNICRHRQAIMRKGSGNCVNIVCDLHRWTYNNHGELISAPLFQKLPNCKNLVTAQLNNWRGLLFLNKRSIADDLHDLGQFAKYIDFTNYQYSNTQITDYDFNWKTFMEVYAEDYHVDPYHPGLGNFVDCSSLQWSFGTWHHLQIVPAKLNLHKTGTKLYQQWSKKVLAASNGNMPDFGAIWMAYYPNIMIECYPKTIVISVVEPIAPEKCRVLTEFYYPDEILGFDQEYVDLQQQVYFETASEDDEICYRMHQGRKSLYLAGIDDNGPYHTPTEDGLAHFHTFLRRELKTNTA